MSILVGIQVVQMQRTYSTHVSINESPELVSETIKTETEVREEINTDRSAGYRKTDG